MTETAYALDEALATAGEALRALRAALGPTAMSRCRAHQSDVEEAIRRLGAALDAATKARLDEITGETPAPAASGVEGPLKAPFTPPDHTGDHRREHRPGPPPKLDTDPELRAFVEARIDHLTFAEIAAAVADQFPPARRVGRSTIHAWWKRSRR